MKLYLGMGLPTGLGTSLRLMTRPAANGLGKGGAHSVRVGVYLPYKRRHPRHEDHEVQQDVEGHRDHPSDQSNLRIVKRPL
jgi:hypothetical protein